MPESQTPKLPTSLHDLLKPEDIAEFRRIVKECTGNEITDAEAVDLIVRLTKVLGIVRDVIHDTSRPTIDT